MGFASFYLEEKTLFPQLIKEAPSEDTGIIVVIPSYDEPGITDLLDSLALCNKPSCDTEVLIIVNAPLSASPESINNNLLTLQKIEKWRSSHPVCFFRTYVIDVTSHRFEEWGVGMARKTGMDEALRRFDFLGKPDGIILNLDADCKVKGDYFTAVFGGLSQNKDRKACSIYFEHSVSGNEFPRSVYNAIVQYELHLRYFFQAVAYTGFPYVHHSIGSAIAVKALPYCRSGGMNRRKAGEDFYFIQKLVPAGGFFNLYTTAVYPSPRSSFRVPFGTGPVISKISESEEGVYTTYDFKAFKDLNLLFGGINKIIDPGQTDPDQIYDGLPERIKSFVGKEEWSLKIQEFVSNTSNPGSFRKRFYSWFNMFKIVKYLNHVHFFHLEKKPVNGCASELLVDLGIEFRSREASDLLVFFRALETGG